MKLKNFLISFAVILSSLFITTAKVNADAPNTITIKASDLKMLYGIDYLGNGSTLNFTYKKTSDGQIVYCTEIHDSMVTSGSEDYSYGKEMDAKFAYVLANGYPNKSITGDSYKDYYITGLAIWNLIAPNDSVFTYFNLSAGTYKGESSQIVSEVAKLVNGAKSYSYVNPSIKINANNTFTISSDKKYYVSNAMSVTTSGISSNYSVSLNGAPNGSIITDTNGNVKNSFAAGEYFVIMVPTSAITTLTTNFSVTVSGTGSMYKAYLYNPSNKAHQSLVTAYKTDKTVSDSANFSLNITTKVEVSKKDATTGEELPGAHLVVKDANGKVVEEWTSTNEVHVITNLVPGKYTLTETIAPAGFKLSTNTIEFVIRADGSVSKVEMKNYPEDEKSVYISKQDATTGEELPGAHLVLKDSKGKEVESWVSGNTPHKIVGLKPGKYTLTETIAPEGYVLSTDTVTFTVEKDGSVKEPVIMKNYPQAPKSFYVSKQDATTGEELPGAYLEIRDENGEIVEAWISGDTPHRVEGLEPGKYTLTETIAPDGYELSKETVEFIVKEDGTVDGMVIMYNKPEEIFVPSTSSFKTITASLIGVIIIGLGAMMIYKNYKKNEEI